MPRSFKEIIEQAEELADRFEHFEPDPRGEEAAKALAGVHRAALRRAEAEAAVVEAIRGAREHDVSWNAIGRAIGTSGEAARQRYGQPTRH